MTRFLFAVPVLALTAAISFADTPASSGTTTAPTTVTTVASTYSYSTTRPARRGLFSRLRNRNTTTYSSAPLMVSPATPPQTPAPTPAPLPAVKPVSGKMMPMSGQVVQATGNLPPGTYTTTDGMVVQVGGKQTMQPQSQSQTTRRGLFSRLRNR